MCNLRQYAIKPEPQSTALTANLPGLAQYIRGGRGYAAQIVGAYVQQVVNAAFVKVPLDAPDTFSAGFQLLSNDL